MRKMRALRRALRGTVGQVVGYQIRDGYGASVAPVLERMIRGERITDSEFVDAMADDDISVEGIEQVAQKLAAPMIIPAGRGGKATALVSVRGVALYDVEFQPFAFSTLLLSQTVAGLANDPEVGTIVLDIDSPGGVVTGTQEAGDAIFAARKGANVVALVNPLAASAAYWLASQANEIAAVPSADIGSIGVFLLHAECSGMLEAEGVKPTFIFAKDSPFKTEGNPLEPLADEAREYMQGEVDTIMSQFVGAVARGRGVSRAKVLSDFGGGRTMMAQAARSAGMVDRVATINQAMARWGVSAQTLEGRRRGEDVTPEPAAENGEDARKVMDADVEADDALMERAAALYAKRLADFNNAKDGEIVARPMDDKLFIRTTRKSADGDEYTGMLPIENDDGSLNFARVGGPPDDWNGLRVIDEDTGDEITHVHEVNAVGGWLYRGWTDENGDVWICDQNPPCARCDPHDQHIRLERLEGNFRIKRREQPAEAEAPDADQDEAEQIEQISADDSARRKRRLARLRHA